MKVRAARPGTRPGSSRSSSASRASFTSRSRFRHSRSIQIGQDARQTLVQRSGPNPLGNRLRIDRQEQAGRQGPHLGIVQPQCDPIKRRRLPLAVQVVARLENRTQRGVANRGDRNPGDQPADHTGFVQDDLEQFAVGGIEVPGPDRHGDRSRRLGRAGMAAEATPRRPESRAGRAAAPDAGRPAQIPQPAIERLDGNAEPLRERVECLGQPSRQARPGGPRGAGRGSPSTHSAARRESSSESRSNRASARSIANASGSTARSTRRGRPRPPPAGGSRKGRGSRAGSGPGRPRRAPGTVPATGRPPSGPPRRRRRPGRRGRPAAARAATWSSPRAVPSVPTKLASPAWCAAITSVYPSTTATQPAGSAPPGGRDRRRRGSGVSGTPPFRDY